MKSYNFEKAFNLFKKSYKKIPLENFKNDPYKILISTILSSRTKDEVTYLAAKRLFKVVPTIHLLQKAKIEDLEKLIYPVGFYKTKAKRLHNLCKIIIHKYNGIVPNTQQALLSLPGVGRKTANLVLNRAFNISAIAVDTHVHRITNFLGWVKTKTPDETEKELVRIVQKKYWKDLNRFFVSIGKRYRTIKKLENFLRENGLSKLL